MKLRRSIVGAAIAAAILATTALGGVAQDTATSSVTIGSGAFTTSLSSSNFANLPYSLTDQYARGGNITVLVNDQTGDGDGWQVTLTTSDFVGQTRPTQNIPAGNLVLTGTSVSIAVDGSQPVNEAQMPVGETTTVPPKLTWSANPGFGQGGYYLRITADLLVPGRTSSQTYTSTATLAVVTGP